jgi:5-(carboxyamino)imidazole ribonucleotide synthase
MSTARVGIIGGGQLGRMLALAGYPLDINCRLLDPNPDACAADVAPTMRGRFDSAADLKRLASAVDVVTFDIENVPAEALAAISGIVPIHPAPAAIATAQDRLLEKQLFQSLGIPTAAFRAIEDANDLGPAIAELGVPLVIKSRRLGYDGRGQRVARSLAEAERGWKDLGQVPAIAEAWIDFDRELSLIGVCGTHVQKRFYPLSENVHRDGILRHTVAPYANKALQQQAERWLDSIFARFDYRGVLTVEFFHAEGKLIANEMAPRVHNSGHWTIEGAETSQFENHLRAVLGWPLGDTSPRGHAAMANLLGAMPQLERVLATPGVHLHHYGKEPLAGRKLGHCTILDSSRERLLERLQALQQALPP